MTARQNWSEILITFLIRASGYSAILFVTLILVFLLKEGLPTLGAVSLSSLLSTRWYPIENYFGILPLIFGSLLVTLGAALVAVPFGLLTAIFISEVAPRWASEVLKPLVEVLAGLPSVVLGFLGILVVSPLLRRALGLPTGLTAFTGSLLLGGIAIPTIVSIAEDALYAVPPSYRAGLAGAGSHGVADHLARGAARRPLGRADRRHAGPGTRHRRDHGGDDGHRQRPGHAAGLAVALPASAHHDRHHRRRDGRGGHRQHALPRAVLHRHRPVRVLVDHQRDASSISFREPKRSERSFLE